MATLVREQVEGSVTIGVNGDIRNVLERAREKLGYVAPSASINRPLADALRKLDIQPFTKKSVDAYKRRQQYAWTDFVKMAAFFAWVIAAPFAAHYLAMVDGWDASNTKAITVISAVAGPFLSGLFVFGMLEATFAQGAYRWRMFPLRKNDYSLLGSYDGEVPVFVLNKAMQIQDACYSTVSFFIDQRITAQRARYLRDPFLVAQCGSEQYYIEVWDEPKFEATL